MTLSQYEQSLVPSATPQLSRACAGQCAGAAYAAREHLARGIPWAEAQSRVLTNARHAKQLAAWNQDTVFAGLTGP